jgi:ribose 5-phosphate isomerase B
VIIAVASDHAGYQLKDQLRDWLREAGHEVLDLGTNSRDTVDYPRFGSLLAETVAAGKAEHGIAVCGSGIGISIAVNRHPPAAARWSTSRSPLPLPVSTTMPISLPSVPG